MRTFNKYIPDNGCEQYKVCDSGTHRLFVLLVMALLIISCGYSYLNTQTQLNEIRVRRDAYVHGVNKMKIDVVYNAVNDIGMYEHKASELMALRITNKIHDAYGDDLTPLLTSFKEERYAEPKFAAIVNNVIHNGDGLVHTAEHRDAGYFIFVKDRLLYNLMFTNTPFSIPIDEFVSRSFNQYLSHNFIDMIKHCRSEVMVIEPKKRIWGVHEIVPAFTYEKLSEMIFEEGMASIAGYYVVNLSYITKEGDIFNINDFDAQGDRADNFKIAVVPYMSLYEYLLKYRKHNLDALQSLENEVRKRADIDMKNLYYDSISSLIVHLCVIFVILNISKYLFFRNLIAMDNLDEIKKKLEDRV